MHIRKILVAFDGSPQSGRALSLAEDMSGAYDAELILVSVIDPGPRLAGEPPLRVSFSTHEQRREMEKELEQRAEGLRSRGRRVATQLEMGDPAATLLSLADKLSVDILIAGRSGKGAVARVMIGSVATNILHHSSCPVCVVP